MTVFGKPPVDVEEVLAHVLAWGLENGVVAVSEADVVEIVSQYEGDAVPEPFELVAVEPFVERRKQVAVS